MTIVNQFSPLSGADIEFGGLAYGVQSANRPWSIRNPDPHTLRFEIRSGDTWRYDPEWKERSEIAGRTLYASGKQIEVSYSFKVAKGEKNEATGAAITGDWLTIGQFHSADQYSSSLFAVELIQEKLAVRVGYRLPGEDYQAFYPYISKTDITRGRYYDIDIEVHFHNNSLGFLRVTLNGEQIVNYHGPIGYGFGAYWKMGIYRREADETIAVSYRDLDVVGDEGVRVTASKRADKIFPPGMGHASELTKGGDVIYGLGGADFIVAWVGDDIVFGGPGSDRINGRSGDDTIIAGAGDDRMRGGAGHDTFFLIAGKDDDVVLDFNTARDVFASDRSAFESYEEVSAAIRNTPDGALIPIEGGSVLVADIQRSELTEQHFLFV